MLSFIQMNIRLKILLLFLPLTLSWQTGVEAASLSVNDVAEIQSATDANHIPSYPSSQGIFGFTYHSGESGEQSNIRLRLSNSENGGVDTFYNTHVAEFLNRKRLSFYLHYSAVLEVSYSLKKKLFPFHSHL